MGEAPPGNWHQIGDKMMDFKFGPTAESYGVSAQIGCRMVGLEPCQSKSALREWGRYS